MNSAADADLARHRAAFAPVTDCPLRDDGQIEVLAGGMTALRAMWAAMEAAEREIVLEFYTFEDIAVDGVALSALLARKLAAGVRVVAIYDGVGSDGTPDRFFDGLRRAGAAVMEFRSLNPFRRFFSLRFNDRDHRKILVVDGHTAFLGGVNLDAQYLNPRSAGIPPDRNTKHAFWEDAAARFLGHAAADARRLFFHTWQRYGGDRLAIPDLAVRRGGGVEQVCVEGSAPREGEPLHLRALAAALEAARTRVWLASGYFVPMPGELRALCDAARRGVDVRLVVPGVSDVMGAVHAARATYGKLIRAGVRVHELRHAVLHAKVSTVDGVWTSIGSSNLDRRSAVLNNEVDAVVLGRETAAATEAMMRAWFEAGTEITLAEWRGRSLHERVGELTALGWKRFM